MISFPLKAHVLNSQFSAEDAFGEFLEVGDAVTYLEDIDPRNSSAGCTIMDLPLRLSTSWLL